jgi:F-type H+-transporting ATPase subunit a
MMSRILFAAGGIPEAPHLLTFIYKNLSSVALAAFVHSWENIFYSVLIGTLLSIFFCLGIRKSALIPSGVQNFLEWIVEAIQNLIVEILGTTGQKYIPFLGTLFLYILSMNVVGMFPLMKAPSSSLNITVGLALCVFFYVQYLNIKNKGFLGFLYYLAGSPKDRLGWMIVPLMFPVELLTELSRPITLSLRLYGNIFGEKILISYFTLVGIGLAVFFPIQTPFLFLGLLTGIMQAAVFAMLSTVYILLALPTGHD